MGITIGSALLPRRAPPGCAVRHWAGFSADAIYSWKINGNPATHSISRKPVQTRLVQVCTRDHVRIVFDVMRGATGNAGQKSIEAETTSVRGEPSTR